jgi:hypothetical protein
VAELDPNLADQNLLQSFRRRHYRVLARQERNETL